MRNIVILNSLHFSYPLPILMRVSYNTLIVKQNTSDYYKYRKNSSFGTLSKDLLTEYHASNFSTVFFCIFVRMSLFYTYYQSKKSYFCLIVKAKWRKFK